MVRDAAVGAWGDAEAVASMGLSSYSMVVLASQSILDVAALDLAAPRVPPSSLRGACARDDRHAPHAGGPGVEDEGLASGELGDAREQLLGGHPLAGKPGEEADRLAAVVSEGLELVRVEGVSEQCVVAELRVGIERQVVGGKSDVGVEKYLQAALERDVEHARRGVPEEPVVHDE